MRGWTPDGAEADLTEPEASAVRTLLAWGPARSVTLPCVPAERRPVLLATAARLDAQRLAAVPPLPVANSADFRRALIQAMDDPDVERAVHQAVARVQQRRAARNASGGPRV